jgi:hypothetical protein
VASISARDPVSRAGMDCASLAALAAPAPAMAANRRRRSMLIKELLV